MDGILEVKNTTYSGAESEFDSAAKFPIILLSCDRIFQALLDDSVIESGEVKGKLLADDFYWGELKTDQITVKVFYGYGLCAPGGTGFIEWECSVQMGDNTMDFVFRTKIRYGSLEINGITCNVDFTEESANEYVQAFGFENTEAALKEGEAKQLSFESNGHELRKQFFTAFGAETLFEKMKAFSDRLRERIANKPKPTLEDALADL